MFPLINSKTKILIITYINLYRRINYNRERKHSSKDVKITGSFFSQIVRLEHQDGVKRNVSPFSPKQKSDKKHKKHGKRIGKSFETSQS